MRGALAAFALSLTVWPAASFGQAPPSQAQIPSDIGVHPWQDQQATRDAAAAQVTDFGPQTASPLDQLPSRDDLIGYLAFLSAILGIIVATWVVLRVCDYLARPDPAKYIIDDPWVRAQLAKQGLPPDEPSEGPAA